MMTQEQIVPYFDLKRQYELIRGEAEEALLQTAYSGGYILSDKVREFESSFSLYCGSPYGVGVASGTDALVFALRALGIGNGDEVIVPSFTFVASVFAIIHAGARPVFADVDPQTFTLDPGSVEKVISKKTKAILPVHLYGQTAAMGAIQAIAKKYRLKIVEDACQAHGARWKDQKAGSLGDAGAFSFYPTKNLGAMGDGGMLVTRQPKIYEQVKKLRNLGRVDMKSPHEIVGWTSRLDALQAVVLQIKLKRLDEFNRNRRRVAARYISRLQSTPLLLPKEGADCYHVYHLFVVRVPEGKRDALQSYLAEKGIPTIQHYPVPCHRQKSLQPYLQKKIKLPVTDRLRHEILSLPIFPEMTDAEADTVASAIRDFYKA